MSLEVKSSNSHFFRRPFARLCKRGVSGHSVTCRVVADAAEVGDAKGEIWSSLTSSPVKTGNLDSGSAVLELAQTYLAFQRWWPASEKRRQFFYI